MKRFIILRCLFWFAGYISLTITWFLLPLKSEILRTFTQMYSGVILRDCLRCHKSQSISCFFPMICDKCWYGLILSSELPPFSLIRDFGKQNTRGKVSPQNFRQSCVLLTDRIEIYQLQPLVWPSNLLYVMLQWAVIGGFRLDLNFGNRFRGCFVFQSRISTKMVVILCSTICVHSATQHNIHYIYVWKLLCVGSRHV